MSVDVLLLAAGFGSRLRPLTEQIPKPMIEVAGRPLIHWNLEMLSRAGVRKVFINLHYLPKVIEDYVGDGSKWGLDIECVFEPEILDTGGAIKNLLSRFSHGNLLTVNSDILIEPGFLLREFVGAHLNNESRPLVSMLLRPDPDAERYGSLRIDDTGKICGFLGVDYACGNSVDLPSDELLMYTGIQLMSRRVFEFFPENDVFSITRTVYPRVLAQGGLMRGEVFRGYWCDVGTPDRLDKARLDYAKFVS